MLSSGRHCNSTYTLVGEWVAVLQLLQSYTSKATLTSQKGFKTSEKDLVFKKKKKNEGILSLDYHQLAEHVKYTQKNRNELINTLFLNLCFSFKETNNQICRTLML